MSISFLYIIYWENYKFRQVARICNLCSISQWSAFVYNMHKFAKPTRSVTFSRKSSKLQSCDCNNGTWRNRRWLLWCTLCTGNGSPSAELSPVKSPPRSTDKARAVAQSYWYHLNPFDARRHVTRYTACTPVGTEGSFYLDQPLISFPINQLTHRKSDL